MADELKTNDLLNRQYPGDSQIKRSGLNNFMSTLFGWRRPKSGGNRPEFLQVDVGNQEKVGQALLQKLAVPNAALSKRLNQLYDSWLMDTEVNDQLFLSRFERCQQLDYMVRNDPYVQRFVNLCADEATQMDEQDTIINIETPDPKMTRDMYELLQQWGVTPTRIRTTIKQLATYGDGYWSNKISDKGVERIIPLRQLDVTDRLEFDPVRALELKKRREGAFGNFASKSHLIGEMLDTMEETSDAADMFDTKLFGFSLQRDFVVPAWCITHFRVDPDGSQFAPFGESPILGALPSFKQTQATITLQSIARVLNFPTQIYSVTTNDSMDEVRQFATVDRVREAYDNIGVAPQMGNSEAFTVNTRIWVPDGLLKVTSISPNIDIKSTDDIKIYQDRTAVAIGLPKSFFSDEWYGLNGGNSGKSLIQQYKPFGRTVYGLQNAFLEGLADLFRIHFAITGQYDFRVPFTLSMKFPVEEDSKNDAKKNSLELTSSVISMIKSAVGLTEEDTLPPDIIRDIIDKYSFLDAADIMKWTRDASFIPRKGSGFEAMGGGEDEGLDLGGGFSGEDEFSDVDLSGVEEPVGSVGELSTLETEPIETAPVEAAPAAAPETELTAESYHRNRMREKVLVENYNRVRDDLYFKALKEHAVSSFRRGNAHVEVKTQVNPSLNPLLEQLERLQRSASTGRLQEAMVRVSVEEDEEE